MKALIMAGGKGTRLAEITKDELPKPMAKIAGKPIVLWSIENLRDQGVDEIYLSVGHLREKIMDYFGDGEKFGVKINYLIEDEPLGSAGALFYLKDKMDDDFIVCSGDAIFDINIKKMLDYHKKKHSILTMLIHPNLHPYDSDLVVCDANGKVLAFDKKNNVRNYYYNNNVNAGYFIVNPVALGYFKEKRKVSMEGNFIQSLIDGGNEVYAYQSAEYIKDVGMPERFYQTEKDIKNGIVHAKNSRYKQKAVFLDRDGTINIYKGFIRDSDDFELIPGVCDAIKKINASGYLAIVVTNQPVIARGECSFEELDKMFRKMETLLGMQGAYVDGIYFCPHHPHKGYEGEVPELKIECECRKPKIGMLKQAEKDFNLDLSKCVLIGDSNVDIQTARNAGIPVIRVKSDLQEQEKLSADRNTDSLIEAVDAILENDYERKN